VEKLFTQADHLELHQAPLTCLAHTKHDPIRRTAHSPISTTIIVLSALVVNAR
jgi:hypothetical protein